MTIKHRLLRFAVLISAVFLGACATVDPAVIRAQVSGSSIAVETSVKDDISLQWIGTTLFNNERGKQSVPDWQLRQGVLNTAGDVLRKQGTYTTVEVAPDPNTAPATRFRLSIRPTSMGDVMFSTNQMLSGIQVTQRTVFNSAPISAICVVLEGEVVEVATQKSIGKVEDFGCQRWNGRSMDPGPVLRDDATATVKSGLEVLLASTVRALTLKLGLQ